MTHTSGRIRTEFLVLTLVIIGLSAILLLRNPDRVGYELPQLPAVAADQMDRIEIGGPKGDVVLQRKGDHWELADSGYAVDESRIQSALDALADLKLTSLVSVSGDSQRYGLKPDSAIRVKAFTGGKQIRSVILGKVASTYRHTFLQFPEEKDVYHAAGSLRNRFDYSVEDWRDKRVLVFKPEDVQEFTVAVGEKSATFRKKSSPEPPAAGTAEKMTSPYPSWTSSMKTEPAAKDVEALLQSLSGLTCEAFIPKIQSSPETREALSITLTAGNDYHLNLLKENEGKNLRYPGTSSQTPQPFRISPYEAEELVRKAQALFKAPGAEKAGEKGKPKSG